MHKICCILIALNFAIVSVLSYNYPDLGGQYCKHRECCNNRLDSCNQPILGTLCYCDEFCNRTDNSDCCPDYWSHCKGYDAPAAITSCYGQKTKNNCNICKCELVGSSTEMLCEQHRCLIEPDLINEINLFTEANGWRATNYSEFWGRRLDEGIQLRLGTLQVQRSVLRMHPIRMRAGTNSIPIEFDAGTKWPRWISSVQDQGWCGSSWATSTVAVASDRFAIQSKGRITPILSSQQLLSCQRRGQQRCNGGNLDRAWKYIRSFGIVNEECFPYVGEHYNEKCPIPKKDKVKGVIKCPSGSRQSIVNRHKVGPAYRLANETDIMIDILSSGPVQATMKVYHDFFSYKSGIYQHSKLTEKDRTGYHSVRIVGWGQEYTRMGLKKYWKVANSWGRQWGENGYFRILKGINECEIETFVLGTWAEIQHNVFSYNDISRY